MKIFHLVPPAGIAVFLVALLVPGQGMLIAACVPILILGVLASIHHAEIVAHRVGEPFGTLVLAVSITTIEVALIVSMTMAGGANQAYLARDAIYAALMIICTGVVGICLLAGGLRYHEQSFRVEGAASALAALIVLSMLSLVLPTFTTTTPGATYSSSQLAFVAVVSLLLWAAFVYIQSGRYRDYFLPSVDPSDEDQHADPPTKREAWISFGLLAMSLVAVVGLAKVLSPSLEKFLAEAKAPPATLGIIIALLVLLPETGAAVRAARANRFQTSMNLAMGSALASIGLTIPAVAAAAMIMDLPLVLGLDAKNMVLLTVTYVVSAITLGLGRTNVLLGAVHLALFAAFLFLAFVP